MRLWYEDAKAKFSDVQAYEKRLINETEIMLQQHEIFKQSYTQGRTGIISWIQHQNCFKR